MRSGSARSAWRCVPAELRPDSRPGLRWARGAPVVRVEASPGLLSCCNRQTTARPQELRQVLLPLQCSLLESSSKRNRSAVGGKTHALVAATRRAPALANAPWRLRANFKWEKRVSETNQQRRMEAPDAAKSFVADSMNESTEGTRRACAGCERCSPP